MSVKTQNMESLIPPLPVVEEVSVDITSKSPEISKKSLSDQDISSPGSAIHTANSSPKSPALKVEVVSAREITDGQQCSNCATTKTPLWRRAPNGTLICNACGLYLRSNGSHRPVNLKKQPNLITVKETEGSCSGDGRCNGTGGNAACKGCPAYNNRVILLKKHEEKLEAPVEQTNKEDLAIACFNCSTTITPLWRRDDNGNTICNACGLYYKLHGSHRPVKMKKPTIKRRKRNGDKKTGVEANVKVDGSASPVPVSTPNVKSATQSPVPQVGVNLTVSPGMYPQVTSPSQFARMPSPNLFGQIPPNMTVPQATSAPLLPLPHFQYPYGLAQHHFPPYSGGRIPNGPGPVPGPPPPNLYNPLMRPSMQFSNMLPYQPINIPPILLPQQQSHTTAHPEQPQQVSIHTESPKVSQDKPNTSPVSQAKSSTSPSLPSQQSTPPQEAAKAPLAVDFTNSFKANKISIGGLLNE